MFDQFVSICRPVCAGLELSLKLPANEPEAYFAPISPAHSSDKLKGDILNMLQRPPQQQTDDTVNLAAKLGTWTSGERGRKETREL